MAARGCGGTGVCDFSLILVKQLCLFEIGLDWQSFFILTFKIDGV